MFLRWLIRSEKGPANACFLTIKSIYPSSEYRIYSRLDRSVIFAYYNSYNELARNVDVSNSITPGSLESRMYRARPEIISWLRSIYFESPPDSSSTTDLSLDRPLTTELSERETLSHLAIWPPSEKPTVYFKLSLRDIVNYNSRTSIETV